MTLEEQISEIAAKGAQSAFEDFKRVYEAQMVEQEKRILASMQRMLDGIKPPAPAPVPAGETLSIIGGKLAVNGVVDDTTNNVVAVGRAAGYTSVHRNQAGDWWARKAGVWVTVDPKLVVVLPGIPTISGGAPVAI